MSIPEMLIAPPRS